MDLDRLLARLDVRVDPFAICQVAVGWGMRLPPSGTVMLHFVLRGAGTVRTHDGPPLALRACSLAVIPAALGHRLEAGTGGRELRLIDPEPAPDADPPVLCAGPAAQEGLRVACGLVRVRYGAALGVFDHLREILVEDLSATPGARLLFEQLLEEQREPRPGGAAMTAALMSQCVVLLFRRLCTSGRCGQAWLRALDDDRIARALERVVEAPADPHTVESLAAHAAMSRSAFAKRFRELFGTTPMAMVRRTRLEAARNLLARQPELPIEVVARRVGFASRSYFSRSFQREMGVAPGGSRRAG